MHIQGDSIHRDQEKNLVRGWTLIAITAEPSLYLNVQIDGKHFRQLQVGNRKNAMRIGEMMINYPIVKKVKHEAYQKSWKEVWQGNRPLLEDRDLYRVQMPTSHAIGLLDQMGNLLPAGDRFEVYREAGMVRADYRQKGTIKVGLNDSLVLDAGYGRYAVVSFEGKVRYYENHREVVGISGEGESSPVNALYDAMNWVSYEPIQERG